MTQPWEQDSSAPVGTAETGPAGERRRGRLPSPPATRAPAGLPGGRLPATRAPLSAPGGTNANHLGERALPPDVLTSSARSTEAREPPGWHRHGSVQCPQEGLLPCGRSSCLLPTPPVPCPGSDRPGWVDRREACGPSPGPRERQAPAQGPSHLSPEQLRAVGASLSSFYSKLGSSSGTQGRAATGPPAAGGQTRGEFADGAKQPAETR